jgi:hypothetical protein
MWPTKSHRQLTTRQTLLTPVLQSFLRIKQSFLRSWNSPNFISTECHYCVHKSLPLEPKMSQIITDPALIYCFCNIYTVLIFFSVYCCAKNVVSFLQAFWTKFRMPLWFHQCALHYRNLPPLGLITLIIQYSGGITDVGKSVALDPDIKN